jgi:hypothetical protein
VGACGLALDQGDARFSGKRLCFGAELVGSLKREIRLGFGDLCVTLDVKLSTGSGRECSRCMNLLEAFQ